MVIIFGVWMSPFCLLWLLPLVFTGMAMLLQSLGFHHGKTGICADSRGRWKTNKPLGTYGNWDTALKGMSILVKKIDKSKAMLTPGFVSSIGQIQTQEKEEVPPFRPRLNLARFLCSSEECTRSTDIHERSLLFLWLSALHSILVSILLQFHKQGPWA